MYVTALASYLSAKKNRLKISQHLAFEEEKRHAMFASFRAERSPNTINKDLGYSSYKKRHRMILTEGSRESRRVKAAALLNNLKHETAGLLRSSPRECF
ncbi:Hypothetical protein FKW44_022612 [Caligus rogercresseyi]|uniref:Uncharacterized protein n=1 Tax=Caligus rogercresseyi TaxID=217165 RepID=A0A7T8GN87_CALRO|nr:Hypothetical protein FKW44_022612 [Caligus rogercresseyi]